MSKKKIYLEITPFFPTPDKFYGPYVYDQAAAIERVSDYKVIVIKLHTIYNPERPNKNEYVYRYENFDVYNLDVYDLPSSVLPGIIHGVNYKRLLDLIKNKIKIDPNDIAFVHGHAIYPAGALAVELQKNFQIPSLVQHHGLDIFEKETGRLLKGKLQKLNFKYKSRKYLNIINSTSLNIGVSQKVLDVLRTAPGFDNPHQYVLYNGVDTAKFFPMKVERDRSVFTIGCIANFWPLKDHMTLLKALNHLKEKGYRDIRLKLIGNGPTLPACKAYIERQGLEAFVSFEKTLHHRELNAFYNALDLFALPSYYEAFGCVYTEAMQTGVPIIAVKGQGIEEVLKPEDKKYSLIEKGDWRHLAELIEFRYNHRSKVDYDFDIDNYIGRFLRFLEEEIQPRWQKG